jgi:hypothetical protein
MKILNGKEQDYKEWYENQGADYGRACFRFAERWAELLEELINDSSENSDKVIIENADKTSYKADTEGITGFMYGAAVNILSSCWEYGEALRKWHNKEYDYDGDGVVNPAILTIK